MRPGDPRLRAHLAPARRPLVGVVVAEVVGGLLIIAQAWVVTGLVIAVLDDEEVAAWAVAVVATFALRGLSGWVGDLLAARTAAVVGTSLRRRIVAAHLIDRTSGRPMSATGEMAVLATRGVPPQRDLDLPRPRRPRPGRLSRRPRPTERTTDRPSAGRSIHHPEAMVKVLVTGPTGNVGGVIPCELLSARADV